jgi:hypothetical protein
MKIKLYLTSMYEWKDSHTDVKNLKVIEAVGGYQLL